VDPTRVIPVTDMFEFEYHGAAAARPKADILPDYFALQEGI